MKTPIINPQFRRLIPPLSAEERDQLERNIRAEGCRDPLVTWNGTLLDGHNRLEICQKHDLPFQVKPIDLPSEDAALFWIVQNQLGRRNLSTTARCQLALRARTWIHSLSRQGERTDLRQKSDEVRKPLDTKKELAKLAGVSHDTLAKVAFLEKYASPGLLAACRNGEMSINAAHEHARGKAIRSNSRSARPVTLKVFKSAWRRHCASKWANLHSTDRAAFLESIAPEFIGRRESNV